MGGLTCRQGRYRLVRPLPPRPITHARLLLPGGPHELATLVDSGAETCIIGGEATRHLGLGQDALPSPVPARALDGHQEQIQFHILDQPDLPLILGFPWLCCHNPHIDLKTGTIWEWGTSCHRNCLKQAVPSHQTPSICRLS